MLANSSQNVHARHLLGKLTVGILVFVQRLAILSGELQVNIMCAVEGNKQDHSERDSHIKYVPNKVSKPPGFSIFVANIEDCGYAIFIKGLNTLWGGEGDLSIRQSRSELQDVGACYGAGRYSLML